MMKIIYANKTLQKEPRTDALITIIPVNLYDCKNPFYKKIGSK